MSHAFGSAKSRHKTIKDEIAQIGLDKWQSDECHSVTLAHFQCPKRCSRFGRTIRPPWDKCHSVRRVIVEEALDGRLIEVQMSQEGFVGGRFVKEPTRKIWYHFLLISLHFPQDSRYTLELIFWQPGYIARACFVGLAERTVFRLAKVGPIGPK